MTNVTTETSRARTWPTTTLVVLASFVTLAFVPPASASDGYVGATGATTSVVRFTYDGWREIEEVNGALGTGIAAEVTKSPFVAGFSPFHQAKAAWTGRENFTGRELSAQERLMCGLDAALSILGPLGKLAQGGSAVLKFAGYARQFDAGLKAIQGGLQIAELVQTGVEMAAGVTASIGEEFESIAEAMAVPDEGMDNCFLAGTPVKLRDGGIKRVEKLRLGDKAPTPPGHACDDPRCGEVVQLFHNVTDEVVTLVVKRPRARDAHAVGAACVGAEEPPQVFCCTPGHPFRRPDGSHTLAGDLRVGDELVGLNGEPLLVAGLLDEQRREQTFNVEIRCSHAYPVGGRDGATAVWVHNDSLSKIVKSGSALIRRVRIGSGAAFRAGGRRLGQFFRGIGSGAEDVAKRVLSQVPGVTRLSEDEFRAGNGRLIDWFLGNKSGSRALAELKYAIPTRGPALGRMVGQVQGMAAESSVRRLVWSLKAPAPGAVARVRALAGVGEDVEFVHGVRGLYGWLSNFAR